jgi:hypothetical protein
MIGHQRGAQHRLQGVSDPLSEPRHDSVASNEGVSKFNGLLGRFSWEVMDLCAITRSAACRCASSKNKCASHALIFIISQRREAAKLCS